METRICKDCQENLPLTAEYFRPHGSSKKGFRHYCKNCSKAREISRHEGTCCKVEGCCKPVKVDSSGLCGMHQKRLTVYGDVNYVMPKNVWKENCRTAALKTKTSQPHTYKKLHNRHEHRVIAEQMLGRKLHKGEVVHHMDKDKHNNHPANLMVFPSQKEHVAWHCKNDPSWGRK